MNLLEAYEIYCLSSSQDKGLEHKAFITIYDALQDMIPSLKNTFPKLRRDENAPLEIIHDILLRLPERARPLRNSTVQGAKSALYTSLRNYTIDFYRRKDQHHLLIIDSDPNDAASKIPLEIAAPEAEDNLIALEKIRHSSIIHASTSEADAKDALFTFLIEVAAPQIVEPSAVPRTRQNIMEMQALDEETTTFDDLVLVHYEKKRTEQSPDDEPLPEQPDKKEAAKIRTAIQQRHSRTRARLHAWLKNLDNSDDEALRSLSTYDRNMLFHTIELMRSRAAKNT